MNELSPKTDSMITLRFLFTLFTALTLAVAASAPLAAAEGPCVAFCKGQKDFGVGFSGGSSGGESYFVFSGHFGYFFADGFELGISVLKQTYPSYLLPELFARVFFLPRSPITPFAIGRIGYLIASESGYADSELASLGGGVSFRLGQGLYFTAALLYQHFFNQEQYESGITYQGGFGFYL